MDSEVLLTTKKYLVQYSRGTYMDEKTISEAIKKAKPVLEKGDRVELIPVKDGVKVVRVKREEVKSGKN